MKSAPRWSGSTSVSITSSNTILEMSKWGARRPFVPMGRADHTPTDPGNVPPEVAELAQAGKRKDAVTRYRELTGADVEQAIAAIDGLSS